MANNEKRFRLHPLFKRGMAFLMVIAPFWWLVMTDDGQRRSDLVMNTLFGEGEAMNLSFSKLTTDARLEDFQSNWPELDFRCGVLNTPYGDHYCKAALTESNGVPARQVHLYLQNNTVRAVQLNYYPAHHTYLLTRLYEELGAASERSNVWEWKTEAGTVVAAKQIQSQEDAAVIWIARPSIRIQ